MVTAIYPGTFDPITLGHIDIATRAAAIFDRLIVAVYDAPPKELLFTTQERVEMVEKALKHLPNIEVAAYSELTVDFARKVGAKVMVRGLRTGSDFEYEFEMAFMNKKLAPDVELVCLMTSLPYQFISSSLLKEVARLGGDINSLVPPHVATALKGKLGLPV
jgi:pantetheine-phosphate adenylyltransferase